MKAPSARQKTRVVSYKMPPLEWFIWQSYAKYHKESLAVIFGAVVDYFIRYKMEELELDWEYIQTLRENAKVMIFDKGLQNVTFRVEIARLKEWDEYCTSHFISRTSLLDKSMNAAIMRVKSVSERMHSPPIKSPKYQRLLVLLESVINGTEIKNYLHIQRVFEQVDVKILNQALVQLEGKGRIARKGVDTYVPANPLVLGEKAIIIQKLIMRLL
ncbi:hypothetical protein [Candidatus Lokiarchaeum ossiferum]|uniref:hypothetical protein n=1 Tax=Candidatus Lokiarchaeum ossiferum TaxID=2951803 RepID=UPI00352BEDC5